jgi:CxxH/CxxC protein (TIGR04129 family)
LNEKSKACCEEHLDIGFDDFLVEFETFPVMEDTKDGICHYCSEPAKYILQLSCDKT